MPSTPAGYPYPDPAELVRNGATAIRLLAQSIPDHRVSWVASDLGAGPVQTTTADGAFCTLGGVTGSAQWEFNGSDTLIYRGVSRWFTIAASCDVVATSDDLTAQTSAQLLLNGVVVSRSTHNVSAFVDGVTVGTTSTHKLDTPLLVPTGATLAMTAFGLGEIQNKVIRATSIAPAGL